MAERSERLRSRIALGLAIAIHVAALVAARRLAVREAAPPREDTHEVAIDLAEAPAEPREAPRDESLAPRTVAPSSKQAAASARASATHAHATEHENTRPLETSAPPTTSTPSPEPRPASPPLSLAQLGLEGPNRFALAPSGASSSWTIHDAEDGVRRSIAESLLKHDRSVGLGSEGPAIAAIEEVVVASTAAVNGRAVLSVAADALGVITSVVCVDGDHAQWDAIAAEVTRALGKKRLRNAPGGRGVAMRIEVTSREEMPSGRDPGLEIRAFHIPIKKGRGPRSARMEILDVDPKIVIDDPEQEGEGPEAQAAPVKFPRAHIQIVKLFGLDFDPVDIGAAPRRVVHAHVLDEHPL